MLLFHLSVLYGVNVICFCAQGMTADDFLSLMSVDKKNVDGQIRFILLKGDLGNCIVSGVDRTILTEFLVSQCQL